MKGSFKIAILCIVSAVCATATTILLHVLRVSSVTYDISYTDFISITLTALSLMITVLGIFVAAAGVIGWSTVEKRLKSHSTEYFKVQLSKDGEIRRELEEFFAEIAYSGIDGLKAPPEAEEKYRD